MLGRNINEKNRQEWLKSTLSAIPTGNIILDAGAGELRNKKLCGHLNYISQDFGEYNGQGDGKGLQCDEWDTSSIDIISDICNIPKPDNSFDAILCSEVLEHLPNPVSAIKEFHRLLKVDGRLILTAPFASLVHFAPYHYCSGFSKYWYEYHLQETGFHIEELIPNGDWFALCHQEIQRLGFMSRKYGDIIWPFAYFLRAISFMYFKLRSGRDADDVACFGWHCMAVKKYKNASV
jgi:SAM-dependent methyltransferase